MLYDWGKNTDTRPEYLTLIASVRQPWLRERTSLLCYTYIACLVDICFGAHIYMAVVMGAWRPGFCTVTPNICVSSVSNLRFAWRNRNCGPSSPQPSRHTDFATPASEYVWGNVFCMYVLRGSRVSKHHSGFPIYERCPTPKLNALCLILERLPP
jgi:hypothetical protein